MSAQQFRHISPELRLHSKDKIYHCPVTTFWRLRKNFRPSIRMLSRFVMSALNLENILSLPKHAKMDGDVNVSRFGRVLFSLEIKERD